MASSSSDVAHVALAEEEEQHMHNVHMDSNESMQETKALVNFESELMSTNVTAQIQNYLRILQYNADLAPQPFRIPTVSGFLFKQTTKGEWKQVWCSYSCGHLRMQKREQSKKYKDMAACFCDPEPYTKVPANITSDADSFWSSLEKVRAPHAFKIFTPSRVYLMACEKEALRNEFVKKITEDLQIRFTKDWWQQKVIASKKLSPLLREQLSLQSEKMIKVIEKLNFAFTGEEEDLPINSSHKEKSGVIYIYRDFESKEKSEDNWKKFYAVMYEGYLYYYKDSKAKHPSGFVSLRFASTQIDTKRLVQDRFVFTVDTPVRKLTIKCKHAVALSEWVAAMEEAIFRYHARGESGTPPRNAKAVLAIIDKLLIDVSTFEALLQNKKGCELFRSYLISQGRGTNELDFFLTVDQFRRNKLTGKELVYAATKIYNDFLSADASTNLKLPASPSLTPLKIAGSPLLGPNRTNPSSPTNSPNQRLSVDQQQQQQQASDPNSAAFAQLSLSPSLGASTAPSPSASPSAPAAADPFAGGSASASASQTTTSAAVSGGTIKLPRGFRHRIDSIFQTMKTAGAPTSPSSAGGVGGGGGGGGGGVGPSRTMFDAEQAYVRQLLKSEFVKFSTTPEYIAFSKQVQAKSLLDDVRDIEPFDPSMVPILLYKPANTNKDKEVVLKKEVSTVGRDSSNNIVLDDDRVSRSHGRFEVSKTHCEYFDLGSSKGTKLNGKSILRAKLAPGDVLTLGNVDITFGVRKRGLLEK